MNFKFEEDFKQNLLKLTVSVDRKRYDTKREVYGWNSVQELVSEYKCPNTHTLGECLNPVQAVDSTSDAGLSRTWLFPLIPKKGATKTTAKKTTTP